MRGWTKEAERALGGPIHPGAEVMDIYDKPWLGASRLPGVRGRPVALGGDGTRDVLRQVARDARRTGMAERRRRAWGAMKLVHTAPEQRAQRRAQWMQLVAAGPGGQSRLGVRPPAARRRRSASTSSEEGTRSDGRPKKKDTGGRGAPEAPC